MDLSEATEHETRSVHPIRGGSKYALNGSERPCDGDSACTYPDHVSTLDVLCCLARPATGAPSPQSKHLNARKDDAHACRSSPYMHGLGLRTVSDHLQVCM